MRQILSQSCDGCIGCLRSKAEAPIDVCKALADISRILAQPGFEKAKIIERMRDK